MSDLKQYRTQYNNLKTNVLTDIRALIKGARRDADDKVKLETLFIDDVNNEVTHIDVDHVYHSGVEFYPIFELGLLDAINILEILEEQFGNSK